MISMLNNPITRTVVRGLVTYAYVHMALDVAQGSIWLVRKMKAR